MSSKKAAEQLGLTASRIRQLLLSGELQGEKLGRDWLISEKTVRELKKRREENNVER